MPGKLSELTLHGTWKCFLMRTSSTDWWNVPKPPLSSWSHESRCLTLFWMLWKLWQTLNLEGKGKERGQGEGGVDPFKNHFSVLLYFDDPAGRDQSHSILPGRTARWKDFATYPLHIPTPLSFITFYFLSLMIPSSKYEPEIKANSRKFLIWVELQFYLAVTFECVSYPFLVVPSPLLYVRVSEFWKDGANSSRLKGDCLRDLRASEILQQPGSWLFRMMESQGIRIAWSCDVHFLLKGKLGIMWCWFWEPYRGRGRQSIGSGLPSRAAPLPAMLLRGVITILCLKTRFFGQKKANC